MSLGQLGVLGRGFAKLGAKAGGVIPHIAISNLIISSAATTGTTLGVLSVVGAKGTPTYTMVTDVDGFWVISGANVNSTGALTPGPSTFTVSVSGMSPAPKNVTFVATITNGAFVPTFELFGF